jgi:hypothetical protein
MEIMISWYKPLRLNLRVEDVTELEANSHTPSVLFILHSRFSRTQTRSSLTKHIAKIIKFYNIKYIYIIYIFYDDSHEIYFIL